MYRIKKETSIEQEEIDEKIIQKKIRHADEYPDTRHPLDKQRN